MLESAVCELMSLLQPGVTVSPPWCLPKMGGISTLVLLPASGHLDPPLEQSWPVAAGGRVSRATFPR